MRQFRRFAAFALCAVAMTATLPVYATPTEDVKARQKHFKDLGKTFKHLSDAYKDGLPDLEAAKRDAAHINELAQQLPTWFPAGSGPESKADTHAKAEIWSDPAGFEKVAANLKLASAALLAAVDTGDVKQVGPAIKTAGGACGACHDKFRSKDD